MTEQKSTYLPPPDILQDAVRKICVGPHLSKNLSREECAAVMSAILEQHNALDPVQMGLFLVGLRMKRETPEENAGIYDALSAATTSITADIPDLLHLTDPFDGQNRHIPTGVFMAPVFASCGLPCLVQSVPLMGPKFGITPEQILQVAGATIDKTANETVQDLEDNSKQWGYISQRLASPKLWALQNLRRRMLKRPTLSTLEKLLRPIQARNDWLLTGFIHSAYRETVPQLARLAGFRYCLAQRGVEGSVTPPLSRDSQIAWMSSNRDEPLEETLSPAAVGLAADEVAPVLPKAKEQNAHAEQLEATLAAGRAALQGEANDTAKAIWLQVGQVLWRGNFVDTLEAGIEAARTHCRTGLAWDHWVAVTGDATA